MVEVSVVVMLVLGTSGIALGAYFVGRNDAFTKVRNLCAEILTETLIPFPDLWDIDATVNKQAYTQGRLDALSEIFDGLSMTKPTRRET